MRSASLTLGGREYHISELPSRKNAEWRKRLAGPFGELAGLLESSGDTELTPANIGAILRSISGIFLQSADTLVELLFAYSPELAKDRKHIQENAYDSEIMDAFIEVLKLAYPFGALIERLGRLASGSATARTSQN